MNLCVKIIRGTKLKSHHMNNIFLEGKGQGSGGKGDKGHII